MRDPRARHYSGGSGGGGGLFQCIAPPKNNWTHVLITADLRLQLNEQLRCLDIRLDTQNAVVSELQEYFRRRADVELEYSRSLDKLHKSLSQRHKDIRQKRDQMPVFSSYSCWQLLMNQTRQDARDRAVLADVYSTVVSPRLARVSEDLQRIYKRCRHIGLASHDELLKVLHELQLATKTYNMYYAQFSTAEAKLQYVVNQKAKLETNIAKEKLDKSRKFRLVEKEILKRRDKYQDSRLKAVQARNDLLLCLEAANAAVRRFFVDDLSDLVDCMDSGFHAGVVRALLMAAAGVDAVSAAVKVGVDGLHKTINNLDSRLDKQKFIEANNTAFMLPKKFEFQAHRGDDLPTGQSHKFQADPALYDETRARHAALHRRLMDLRINTEETWKTMETAEVSLLTSVTDDFTDCGALFNHQHHVPAVQALLSSGAGAGASGAAGAGTGGSGGAGTGGSGGARATLAAADAALVKLRADRHETEQFYMSKFRDYISDSNLIARLSAKHELIGGALGDSAVGSSPLSSSSTSAGVTSAGGGVHKAAPLPVRRRRRIGHTPATGHPKLFGGSLEEYLELSGQEIPLIVRSSVRVINQYGLHHQGIFRVSGSQVEINNFRDSFERGEDPLSDVTDASDINSVAGVLKLYLREMREPFFPTLYFEQFMEIAQLNGSDEMVCRLSEVVRSLSRPVVGVMRYLFAFLNHLSEFSDENMMDPYNLAICFGPTLLPIPDDKDQVQYQGLVNELMKQIIARHDDIFPRGGDDGDGGAIYEKYITKGLDDTDDIGEAPSDAVSAADTDDLEMPSEDDSVFKDKDISLQIFGKTEQLEAVAQFDFSARSPRELSFRRGDVLTLYRQISSDWWRGHHRGHDGLVPDKYVLLKIKDEDRTSASTSAPSPPAFVGRASSPSSSSVSSLSTPDHALCSASAVTPLEAKFRAGHSAAVSSASFLSPVSARPPLKHSISSNVESTPRSPSFSNLRRGCLVSFGGSGGRDEPAGATAATVVPFSAARCSSVDRNVVQRRRRAPSAGASVSQGRLSDSPPPPAPSTAGPVLLFSGCPEEPDPESGTGQLDLAMKQIELVTETLRAVDQTSKNDGPTARTSDKDDGYAVFSGDRGHSPPPPAPSSSRSLSAGGDTGGGSSSLSPSYAVSSVSGAAGHRRAESARVQTVSSAECVVESAASRRSSVPARSSAFIGASQGSGGQCDRSQQPQRGNVTTVCAVWQTTHQPLHQQAARLSSTPTVTSVAGTSSSSAGSAAALSSVKSKRALWENLSSSSASTTSPSPAGDASSQHSVVLRRGDSEPSSAGDSASSVVYLRHSQQQKHTPDLVRDLPHPHCSSSLSGGGGGSGGSEEESSPGAVRAPFVSAASVSVAASAVETTAEPDEDRVEVGSGGVGVVTAAETFARQNQCTIRRGRSSPEPRASSTVAETAAEGGAVRPSAVRLTRRPQVAPKFKPRPEPIKKASDS